MLQQDIWHAHHVHLVAITIKVKRCCSAGRPCQLAIDARTAGNLLSQMSTSLDTSHANCVLVEVEMPAVPASAAGHLIFVFAFKPVCKGACLLLLNAPPSCPRLHPSTAHDSIEQAALPGPSSGSIAVFPLAPTAAEGLEGAMDDRGARAPGRQGIRSKPDCQGCRSAPADDVSSGTAALFELHSGEHQLRLTSGQEHVSPGPQPSTGAESAALPEDFHAATDELADQSACAGAYLSLLQVKVKAAQTLAAQPQAADLELCQSQLLQRRQEANKFADLARDLRGLLSRLDEA